MYPFEDEFVLMAIGSNARSDMVFINEGKGAGSPLVYSLGLDPEFVDRCSVSDCATVVTGYGLVSDVKLGSGGGQEDCGFAAVVLGVVVEGSSCSVGIDIQLSFQRKLCVGGMVILVAFDVGEVWGIGWI